mgnify:CR=1 FL=1
MACTCQRLGKKSWKLTRLKKGKSKGLPAEAATADERDALSQFIEKKRKRTATRKGRKRARTPGGQYAGSRTSVQG